MLHPRVPPRGASDRLSSAQVEKLEHALEQYVVLKLQSGTPSLRFGDKCGSTNMDKKAPEFQTLLSNADLWELILGHFKTCKSRDSYFARCLHNIIGRLPGAKTCEQYPDDVFVV